MRWKTVFLAGGLLLAPAASLAQSTTDPQTKTPPSDAIGPSELQNFSLSGTPTRPADQQSTPPAPQPQVSSAPPVQSSDNAAPPPERHSVMSRRAVSVAAKTTAPAAKVVAPSASPVVLNAPPVQTAPTVAAAAPSTQPGFATATQPSVPADPLAPDHKLSILPWLLAALVLAGAAVFLFWRRHSRQAFAGVPQLDMFVPPEAAPAPPPPAPAPAPRAAVPQPQPAAPKPVAPAPRGIVSTRLRPTLEILVKPTRCVVDEQQVTLAFELELFNGGAAPARNVFAEARLLNAGVQQEQELAAFYSQPAGLGERIDAIPPMQRMAFASEVVLPRAAVQEYDLAGRKAIVPVLAFNAFYRWSGGEAQTSAACLVGRETRGDKLGPLTLDRQPREFGSLAARVLPTAVRT